jgi:hypothetical protein
MLTLKVVFSILPCRQAKLRNLVSSPNTIRNIGSKWMRWAGHVASIGEMRNAYNNLVENTKGKYHLGDLRANRKTMNQRNEV